MGLTYLITTEIKGVSYWANITKRQPKVQYQWEGIKNNATKFEDRDEAIEFSENMESKHNLKSSPTGVKKYSRV